MSLDGSFGAPSFNCIGDPYHDPKYSAHGESKGQRQFLAVPSKTGQTASSIGYGPSNFKALYDGSGGSRESYEDGHKKYARERLAARKKWRTPNGFGYSSPMKASSSPGDITGTFNNTYEHIAPKVESKARRQKKTEFSQKQMLVHPQEKGGCGYSSGYVGGKIPTYVHHEYDAGAVTTKKERELHIAKTGDRRTFISTSKRLDAFDAMDHCAASKVYSTDVAPMGPSDFEKMTPKDRAALVAESRKIFKPSSPHKHTMTSTHSGTLNPFPEYKADPVSPRTLRLANTTIRRQPMKDATAKLSEKMKSRPPYMPSAGPKSGLQKSVMMMNLSK